MRVYIFLSVGGHEKQLKSSKVSQLNLHQQVDLSSYFGLYISAVLVRMILQGPLSPCKILSEQVQVDHACPQCG